MGAAAANGGAGAAKVASKTPQAQAPLPLEQAAHPKLAQDDQAEAYDHDKERAARQARRDELKEYRRTIEQLPLNHWWESPGRPTTVFGLRHYGHPSALEGRRAARDEVPFLFKAFESGQQPPPRPGTKRAELPRAATIHEYLDWTVTASEPEDPDELDFGGFRVLALAPRFRLQWPPPPGPYNAEAPLAHPQLGAPRPPVPHLAVHQKPICAATVRVGPSWLEVPFYATQETRRNKGNGRALLEAIEDVCRMLRIPRVLLCSTDDPKVKATWQRLGFSFTSKEDLEAFGVSRHDLLHMDNTVQMHKEVPPQAGWRPVLLRHQDFVQRLYYLPGGGGLPPVVLGKKRVNGARQPSKQPAKKRVRIR